LLPGNLSSKRVTFSDQWDITIQCNSYDLSQTQFTSNTSYMFEAVNGVNHNHVKNRVNKQVTFRNVRDSEIQSDSHAFESKLQSNKWQMPDKMNLDSTSLKKNNRSLIHACLVLFSSFCAIGAGLK
jgi:hypothetical protein